MYLARHIAVEAQSDIHLHAEQVLLVIYLLRDKMPQFFLYLTDAGQIETEVNMNGVEGWAITASCSYEKDGAKSTIDQSTGIVENVASRDSCASERSDENFAQEGLKHVVLENYFKRKREEKSDPIEYTQVVDKKFRSRYDCKK